MNLSYIQQNTIGKPLPLHQEHHHSGRQALVKPRSAFIDRFRQQSLPPNVSKTISARADPFPQAQPRQVSLSLAKFDRMQLQDFLKVVIVGEQKVSEDKSKQIICSLNGTWFKNTNSDRPACKFYNSIGIRKHRNAATAKKLEFNPISDTSLMTKDYSPPNGFPVRKYSPRKTAHSRGLLLQTNNNFTSEGELKGNVLKKMIKVKPSKRSYSSFLNRDVVLKQAQLGEALVKGKRMIIHD